MIKLTTRRPEHRRVLALASTISATFRRSIRSASFINVWILSAGRTFRRFLSGSPFRGGVLRLTILGYSEFSCHSLELVFRREIFDLVEEDAGIQLCAADELQNVFRDLFSSLGGALDLIAHSSRLPRLYLR